MWCRFRGWTGISGTGWTVSFAAPFPILDRPGLAPVHIFAWNYKQPHYRTGVISVVADSPVVMCLYATFVQSWDRAIFLSCQLGRCDSGKRSDLYVLSYVIPHVAALPRRTSLLTRSIGPILARYLCLVCLGWPELPCTRFPAFRIGEAQ